MKRITLSLIGLCVAGIFLICLASCKGKKSSADTGNTVETAPAAPVRAMLSAEELLELGTYPDAAAVQLFMKEKQQVFLYARKGEYLSLAQGAITDTAGQVLALPLSTVYFASEPGSTWRIAQTVHTDSLKNVLLKEFMDKGYTLSDSLNYYATDAKAYRYQSSQHPGRVLYYSPTTTPWYKKGIYLGASWQSHCFEISLLHE